MALTKLKQKWENFTPRSDYQQTIKDGACAILDENPSNQEDFKQFFEELIPTEILFSYNCLTNNVIYAHVRALVQHYGMTVERRPGLRIATALANAILENDELERVINSIESQEKSLSLAARKVHKPHSDYRNVKNEPSQYRKTATYDTSDNENSPKNEEMHKKSSTNIGSKLDSLAKHFSSKGLYNGLLGHSPSLDEAKLAYVTYCENKSFTENEKVELVTYTLIGPALTFWSNISKARQFQLIEDVFETLAEKFDTPTNQRQIDHMLQNITVKEYELKHKCTKVEALGYVYNEVDRLNALGSKSKRGDIFKAEQLLHIVNNLVWAQDAKKKALSENLSFSQIYSEQSSAALLWEESQRKLGINPSSQEDSIFRKNASASVYFGVKYAVPKFKRRENRKFSGNRDLSNLKCFRCNKRGHIAARCTEPRRLTMQDAIKSRLRNAGDKPEREALKIFLEMAQEIDTQEEEEDNKKDEEDAEEIIEEFFASIHSDFPPPSDV